ncbi:MAG TPA: BamA/TamA family outer membrane protein, partial [Thermoanaerobaculia bacterium]|nr:BamA/TamA family outer membrane protein [Thermoanaerobaculia bacterium]
IGNTIAYANFEFRFPLIDLLAFPFGGFTNIRGHFFVDVGGAALKDQKFRFWDASQHQLVDGRASYGYGLQIQFLGLLLHWDFAHLTDFRKTYSGLRTSFYIGTEF